MTPPAALATEQMDQADIALAPPDLERGAAIYAEKCAACHGVSGLGDGELAATLAFQPAPLGDPKFASEATLEGWYQTVTEGNLERLMPPFTSLSDQERWDVTAYALSLSTSAAERPAELERSPAAVTGSVANGTPGATIPLGLEVILFGIDGDGESTRSSTALNSDGSFHFDGLEYVPGRVYLATVSHNGVQFRSESGHISADTAELDLPLTIYETSSDPGALSVKQLHLLFDLPEGGTMRVLELWELANRSDRVIVGDAGVRVDLPSSATNLTFAEGALGGRYELTNSGFVDWQPVLPGSGIEQLAFGYELPVDELIRYEQAISYPVEAVSVLVPAEVELSGLQLQGEQDLGGFRMRNYVGKAMPADEPLTFALKLGRSSSAQTVNIVVGALMLAIGAGVAFRVWTGEGQESGPDLDSLVRAMASLDDQFEAEELDEEVYRRQRKLLKQQALLAMQERDD